MTVYDYKEEKERKLNNRLSNVCSKLPGYAAQFIDYRKSIGFNTSTLLIYAYELDQFLSYEKKLHPDYDIKSINFISSIDHEMLCDYLSPNRSFYTKNGQRAKNTEANLKTKKSVLKAFLDYYYDRGYLLSNCSLQLERISSTKKQVTPLADSDIKKIFDELKRVESQSVQKRKSQDLCRSRDLAIFSILIETGISAEELIALNMDNIHLPTYPNEIDDKNRWIDIEDNYGNVRRIYISRQVENSIRDYWGEDRFALHPLPETGDAFIISQKGTRMSVRALQILVKKHCANAGILNVTPSRLRLSSNNDFT